MNSYKLRPATAADADFLSWGLAAALHMEVEDKVHHALTGLICTDGTLYHWTNAIVAYDEDNPTRLLGVVIAYNGNRYHQMRNITFPLMEQIVGEDYSEMEDEAKAGEYYVDTLAVIPEARRQGIGRALLFAAFERAKMLNLEEITIAVDPVNENAKRLYSSVGFLPGGMLHIFGMDFLRWARKA